MVRPTRVRFSWGCGTFSATAVYGVGLNAGGRTKVGSACSNSGSTTASGSSVGIRQGTKRSTCTVFYALADD